MGKLRKIGRSIGKRFKSLGKKLKSGLGKLAKAFGKLGPLGSIALSFIIPGMGTWINTIAGGSSFLAPIARGIQTAAGFVNKGVGRVFNRVTDVVEMGMNKVGEVFGGAGTGGSSFRNFVSNVTDGFIKPADVEAQSLTFDKNMIGSTMDETITVGKKPTKFLDTDFRKVGEEMFTSDKPKLFSKESKIDAVTGEELKGKARLKASREFSTYKKISPIQLVGSDIIATEDAEKFAQQQQKKATASYFSDVAQTNLIKQQDPTSSYIDFNNTNPSDEDMYNLNNAYGLILG
jgi:hypothetical protein